MISLVLIIVIISSIFSGCWDKVEIDRKGFVSTIGIDVGEDIAKVEELKEVGPKEPFSERELKRLKVTFGYPDISKLGPQKGSTAQDMVLTAEGYSMVDVLDKTYGKSSRSVHFAHARILLLSDELLKYPRIMKEIVDFLERQPQIDRQMLVIVTKGNTEKYINHKPFMEENIENYIVGLMMNSSRNSTILPVKLNQFLMLLSKNGNAILPNMAFSSDNKSVELKGTALIKNYEIKGYLNPIETSDLEILRGTIKGGKKVIFKDGHPVEFSIEGVKRKIKYEKKDSKINFKIYIELEGQLKGYALENSVLNSKALNEIQENFDESLSLECEKVASITQNEFSIDAIGLNDYLEKYHPYVWKGIKSNWEKIYKDSKINVYVTTKIRRIGVIE